ncbi:MAG: hypothetical protein IKU14_00850 [Rhodocyclaceae bacterium]|nr:hypothetical protein [Rhodocyclaceae bacterium]
MFMKKGIIFAVLSVLLAGCGWVVDLATSDDSNYVDFPLGQGKTITLDVKSNVREKYFIIGLRTEYPNVGTGKRNYYYDKASKYPFEISVKGYRLDKNHKEVLFFDEKLTGPERPHGGSWVERREDVAFRTHIGGVRLPPGKYKFVVTDHSKPNPVYQEMKTSIDVYADLEKH